MDAVEFLKERTRMCNYYMNYCRNCSGNEVEYCATLCANAIDLVPIVEQWAKEHPVKTRQSEFLKYWPDAQIAEDGCLNICPAQITNEYRDEATNQCYNPKLHCDVCRHDFWLKEIE